MFSENQFCSLSDWNLLLLTPWVFCSEIFTRCSSLCLLSFGWDFSPRFVPQDSQFTFYWSLSGLKGSFVRVWNCLIFSWVNTHPFDLKFVAFFLDLSGDSYDESQEKNYFGRSYLKFLRKPRLSSIETCEISPYFLQFLFYSRTALKKFTQILPYDVCTHVRRHVQNRMTKRRYGEEKPECFVFWKPVLFTLGLGLTTPYSLGVLVWNFYRTFVTVCIEIWLRFES